MEAFALGVAKGEIDRPMSAEFLRWRVMRHSWDDDQRVRWLQRMPLEQRVMVQYILSKSQDPEMTRYARMYHALEQIGAAATSSGDTAQATDA